MDIETAMDTGTTMPRRSATDGRWIAGFAASAPTDEAGALTPSRHATFGGRGPGDDDEDDDDDDRPDGGGGNIDPDDDEGDDDEDDDDEEPLQVK